MLFQLLAGRNAVMACTPRLCRAAVIAGAGFALASCMATAPPLAGADPSDSSVRVAGIGYRSTLQGYRRQRPAAPAPWIEQNRRVAPQEKPQP